MSVSTFLAATFVIVIGCAIFTVPKAKKKWIIEKNVLGCFLHAITVISEKDGFLYTIAYEQMQERAELIFGIMLEDGSIHMPCEFVDGRVGLWIERLEPMPIPAILKVSVYDLLCDHLCTIEINTNTGAIEILDRLSNNKCPRMT